MPIFDNVHYWLSESLPSDRRVLNSSYLSLNGARPAPRLDQATHVVTNTHQFEGWRRVEEGEVDVYVVTVCFCFFALFAFVLSG